MPQAGAELFSWARRQGQDGLDVRVENPGLLVPVSFLLDDPAPLRNPMFFHRGFRGDVEVVPNAFLSAFADVAERWGIRGKFSLLPYPFGLGRIDRELDGISAAELAEFLHLVRQRVTPLFDLTPEMLTHWNALDLATGRLLPLWEHEWSRRQTRATLTPYLARALEILNAVDLPANGITSPWNFGHGVEGEYVPAILAAQRQVNDLTLTWYFLDFDEEAQHLPPRVMHLDPAAREAVVSIVVCTQMDMAWPTQLGAPATTDALINADGTEGRMVELLRARSPVAFASHWQSLFSNGSAAGLAALEELARRLHDAYGSTVRWTTCSELARYAATAAAVTVDGAAAAGDSPASLAVSSPFACSRFTLSLAGAIPEVIQDVRVDGKPLSRRDAPLDAGTWTVAGGRLYLCWNLAVGATRLEIASSSDAG